MPAPNENILGAWVIQDSDNEATYPDGNIASIGFNEVTEKFNLTWTTAAQNTYTMHQLVFTQLGPDLVQIQGTLIAEFCATFQLDSSEDPPLLSADIVAGVCSGGSAAAIEPMFEEDSLAGTWSSNQRPG